MNHLPSRPMTGVHRALLIPARLFVVLLSLFGLAGCGATWLLYQNLDWLVFEAMDDRFDIRPDQEDWVKAGLGNLHSWHRMTQLPAYRQTLEGLSLRFADGLDNADLAWLEERVERHRRTLVELVVPDLSRFLADLDAEQLARYAAWSQEAIDEAGEPLQWSATRRQAWRLEGFIDRIEPWTGELSTTQVRALEMDVAALPDMRRTWIGQRRQRHQTLLALLSTRPAPELIEDLLNGWWLNLEAGYPPSYVAQRRSMKEQVFALLTRLDAGLTPDQRAQVTRRLEGYVSTIDTVLASR
ncbi:MAG: DUF6279 family lipoprotein [Sedimenticolaceae bacterium]